MKVLPLIIIVCIACGCAANAPTSSSYPAAYRQALEQFPGATDVPDQTIATFTAFLSDLGSEQTPARAEKLYASNLHFSDSLMLTSNRSDVVTHFQGLVDGGTQVEVDVLQTLVEGPDVYLVWSMQSQFTPIRKPVISDSIGITHLRFDQMGQVVMHQDFWDTGQGFYQHVPGLGSVIKGVNKRFASKDAGQ
jgi:hypothetical protein